MRCRYMRRVVPIGLLLAVFTPVTIGLAAGPCELHVAPTGSDANPGTSQRPLATPCRARDLLRQLKADGIMPPGGAVVWFHGGTYYLPASLELTKEDGGTEDSPIVYRAIKGEQPWLNGGRPVDASMARPVTDPSVLARVDPQARGHLVQIELKAVGVGADVPQLPDEYPASSGGYPERIDVFFNGVRMPEARWPNEGFAHYTDIVDTGSGIRDPKGPKRPGKFRYEGDRPSRWDVSRGVWLMGYWARAYYCDAIKVARIDTKERQIDLAVPSPYGLDSPGAKRFYAFNLIEELDSPGEWFLDRPAGVLYFWPPEPLEKSHLVLSRLSEPVVAISNASYVELRGLGLENGRAEGVSIIGGSHNRVVGCTIRTVGRHGVDVSGGTDHAVIGCDVHDTGHAGVTLSGGDRKTLTPANHLALNNHIHHTSRIRPTHAGSLRLLGVGIRAAHNLIHHEPHSAVWYRGNDLVMEYNEIYHAHTETAEGGLFYTGRDWTVRGNVIRYNYIHHINDGVEGSPSGTNVVHLDDCVSGTTFFGNICYRTGTGVSLCGGPDNVIENCIFVDCKVGARVSARGLEWWDWRRLEDGRVAAVDRRNGQEGSPLLSSLKKVPYNKPPYTKYPHLADMLERDPVGAPWFCRVERNVALGGPVANVSRNVKPEWVTVADNWDQGDPGFVDAEHGDFRLKPDSPVWKLGFQRIPVEKIGLIQDETRASWPVVAEPPPAGWKPRWLVLQEQERRMPAGRPIFAVKRVTGTPAIDGRLDLAREWAPADAGGAVTETYETAELLWDARGEKVKYPSKAWIETDDKCLYVAFSNSIDPQRKTTTGHAWGKDDAVEIALAVAGAQEVGPVMLLRGYADGHFESSDEAGAPKDLTRRCLEGVVYRASATEAGHWSAEWKIPFPALGIEPQKRNPRILANLSVRKPAENLWTMWKKAPGKTWDVRQAWTLWLTPFGDVAFGGHAVSQARFDLSAKTKGLLLTPGDGLEVAAFGKPLGSRLTGATGDLPGGQWKDFRVTFVPQADGQVVLSLMGRRELRANDQRSIPVWAYFDSVTVEGADLANGGFEETGRPGLPAGWQASLGRAQWVDDPRAACDGRRCVKVSHDDRFIQTFKVHKDQPVTIRAKVKGEAAGQ